jgi:ribose-phosphate pyrophosphokinase
MEGLMFFDYLAQNPSDFEESLLATQGDPPLVFYGTANEELAGKVAGHLKLPLGRQDIDHFPDGETQVRILESVRGRDAFIIQSTGPSVNDHVMELLIMLDTLRRASATRVTAIIPYYGYARQDRKVVGREPITAKLVAKLIEAAGASRVLCVDLHSQAIQGFFEIGMDHLTAAFALSHHLRSIDLSDSVIVSPDIGGAKRADTYASLLELPLAVLHKRRKDASTVQIAALIGDVHGKRPILVDDIIGTGGTMRQAADELLNAGALEDITVVATHAVLVGGVVKNLSHPAIKRIVVTDSLAISSAMREALPALQIVSLSGLLAQAIVRIHTGASISELFVSQEHGEIMIPWSI